MEGDLQQVSWEWIQAVLISSALILAITGGVFYLIVKLFDKVNLGRLSIWLRWILVLPIALIGGVIGEMIPRWLFATMEIIVNHNLSFRPGFDSLVWQGYAPLVFVVIGVAAAPARRFGVFIVLAGLRICVAVANLVVVFGYIYHGGPWSACDPVTNSPLWWNTGVYFVLIVVLTGAGIYWAREEEIWPFKAPTPLFANAEKDMAAAIAVLHNYFEECKKDKEGKEGEE
jgi:hypothetical protein